MKLVSIQSNTYSYIILNIYNITPMQLDSVNIDLDILTKQEVKGLLTLKGQNKIIVSDSDFILIEDKYNSFTSGGGSDVTKESIGLGSVDNTSDSTKNVYSAGKWTTPRTINFIGNAVGVVSVDGSSDIDVDLNVDLSNYLLKTDTAISQWNTAYTQRHTHSNKTILDNTTASYTTEEKTKVSNVDTTLQHTHSNKTVLDNTTASYTSAEKTKLGSFDSSLQHSHTNKTILDNITASYTTSEKTKLEGLQQFTVVRLTQLAYNALTDVEKNSIYTLYVIVE